MKLRLAALICSFLAVAAPYFAQDLDPDGAKGYVQNVFHHGSVDSINLYNGSLTVPIAIGPSYPVGPKLRYQAMLVYTSRVWEYGNPSNPQPDQLYQPVIADPSLGYGWNLAAGAIKKCGPQQSRLCYVSPDGAEHTFGSLASGFAKTLDASRFYLHFISASAGYEMWDEDGNRYLFDWNVTGFDDPTTNYVNDLGRGRNGWYLRQIDDPFGNLVKMEYYSGLGSEPCWAGTCPNVAGNSYILKNVQVPGATPSNPTIEIVLGTDPSVTGVSNLITKVTCKVSASVEADWLLDYGPPSGTVTVPQLTKITLPPGSSTTYAFTYSNAGYLSTMKVPTGAVMSYYWATYAFHHNRPGSLPPTCSYVEPPPFPAVVEQSFRPNPGVLINAPGLLAPLEPPNPIDCADDNYYKWTDYVAGVVRRTETLGGVSASTDYSQFAFPFGERGSAFGAGPQTLTLVRYPADVDGRRQASATLFTAGPKGSGPALPGGAIGAEIRVGTYDHDPYPNYSSAAVTTPLCGNNFDALCVNKTDRVVYRAYDYAEPVLKAGQRRLKSETTNYGKGAADDSCPTPCKFHKVEFTPSSTWEGNGRHYTLETHTGSPLGGDKTITTTWAPTTTPWQPNIFTHRVVNDLGALAGQQEQDRYFQFGTDGFQKAELTYDNAGNKVLVHCMYPDVDGNVDKELWKTLTGQGGPPISYNCGSSMPALATNGDEFGQDHAYEDGQLKTSCWIKVSTCLPWSSFWAERDDATGMTTSSQDTAGESTSYLYDDLLRVTQIDPPGAEAATNIAYNSPTETVVTRNGGTGLSTNMRYTYDGLGRLVEERRLMPVGNAYRFHKFDGAGNAYFDSEWTSATSVSITTDVATNCLTSQTPDPGTARPSGAPGTYRLCFDPFGRPQQIVGSKHSSLVSFDRADGANIANSDTLEKATTWCVNGVFFFGFPFGCTGGSSPVLTITSDVAGRATQVKEPTNDTTDYAWDVGGELAKVTQGVQIRSFDYNALGFLESETTPEITGAVAYPTYGGVGNVLQKTEGGLTHNFTYDAAGRLLTESVGPTRYVMNCYDGTGVNLLCPDSTPNFAGGNSPKGKLTRQVGTNPAYEALYPLGSSSINTIADLKYSGLGGRVSDLATSVVGGANSSSTQSWVYNNLGIFSTHDHPRFPNGTDAALFRETYSYSAGLPTLLALSGKKTDNSAITGATITATYTPAGTLATYASTQTGSGITQTTTITQDLNLLPRPTRIATSLGGFNTGVYAYDGAGNVLSMTKDASNADTFTYDSLSRLLSAAYKVSGATTSQGATYDRWGNLTGITGTGLRTLTTSATTNRLTAGTGTTFDNSGNLTHFGNQDLDWDGLSRQRKDKTGSVTWQYLHQGDSERVVRVPWWGVAGPSVTRREAARFFTQGEGWAPSTGCAESFRSFGDVHCGDQDWQAIETLYDQGITGGCGGGLYCPDSTITRGQMMVFLLKVEHGSGYTPPPCVGNVFTDVTCGGQFDAYIEQASDEGLTGGCGGSLFCPNNPVTEYQMAVYLNKPVIAPTYRGIPGGSWYTLRDDQDRLVTEFYESFPGRDNVYLGNLLVASYVSHANSGTPGWNLHSSDHLGTVRLTVNGATGATIESLKYWPYGDRYGSTGVPLQKLSFAGMERDGENNHYYDHARTHDFNLGRFVSPDILMGNPVDPQTWNKYTYARNNPQKYVDPNGQDFKSFMLGAANAIGTNFVPGVRADSSDSDYRAGQTVGDLISIPLGAAEFLAGGAIFGGGLTLDATGVLIPAGVAANVAGAAMMTQGAAGSANAAIHLMEKAGSSSTRPDGAKSPNQLNQEIRRGQAPDGITRIDTAKVKGEQVHATFDNKAALNKDGTWKHGFSKLTNEQRIWLRKNGWQFTDN